MNITYEEWKEEWLRDIESAPNTTEKARLFTWKIMKDYLPFDPSDSGDDAIYCDGANDGGIDFICKVEENDGTDDNTNGTTWYIVQSKYNSAYNGYPTLRDEIHKIFRSLDNPDNLSKNVKDEILRIKNFIDEASEQDTIELLFTVCGDERKLITLENDLKSLEYDVINKFRNGITDKDRNIFFKGQITLKSVTPRYIYENQIEEDKIEEDIYGSFLRIDNNTVIGAISLLNFYEFMKRYESKTKNINVLFEKNIRLYLGKKGKINTSISETIAKQPENFVFYNNGVTIVAEKLILTTNSIRFTQPYIVNGCQTSRTIYDSLKVELGHGASGNQTKQKKEKYNNAHVLVKIAITSDKSLLEKITTNTNNQNTVKATDFVALNKKFQQWKDEMEEDYNIFLEIQRGSWEERKLAQRKNSNLTKLELCVYAFDLLKIYGAGWLVYPGIAFKSNAPFQPGGKIFNEIVTNYNFGVKDLYAAYLLSNIAEKNPYNFGRNAQGLSRKQTKSLFFFLVIDFIRFLSNKKEQDDNKVITEILLALFDMEYQETLHKILAHAVDLLDQYIPDTPEDGKNIYNEQDYESNPNNYLKKPNLMKKGSGSALNLNTLVEFYRSQLKKDQALIHTIQFIINRQIDVVQTDIDKTDDAAKGGYVRGGNTISQNNPATMSIKHDGREVLRKVVNYSKDMLVEICKWLILNNKITRRDCPIVQVRARNRCILNIRPYHPDGHSFTSEEEIPPGFYVEINTSHERIMRQIQYLLDKYYPGAIFEWY